MIMLREFYCFKWQMKKKKRGLFTGKKNKKERRNRSFIF
jgi:hypothetical protein